MVGRGSLPKISLKVLPRSVLYIWKLVESETIYAALEILEVDVCSGRRWLASRNTGIKFPFRGS